MRRSPFFALSLLALGAVLPAACTQNFNIFGTGGGGTGGTTTTSSGGGGVGGCTANSECNDTNPCTDDECNLTTGKCSNPPVADGPLGSANVLGDCKEIRCTAGELQTVADDADKPADADPCKVIDCANGSVSTTNEPNGTACGPSPLACQDGSCVGCTMDNDCPMVGDCQQRHCTAEQVCTPTDEPAGTNCNDGGGNVCDGSGACVDCVDSGDCNGTTEICSATNQCVSSCGDGTKNGNETDTDCGGPCPDCGTGGECNTDNDCASGVCTQQAGPDTCAAPTCNDGVRNSAETDTDCGGATCPKCVNGDTCVMGTDCTSGFCVGMVCVSQCSNTVKDTNESDVDCGGTSTCARCANAKNCTQPTDCTSNYCNPSGKCATPTCSDTIKNQNETDVDCGGSTLCPDCANGKDCNGNSDCTSSYCNPSGKCSTPSCTDTFKNQGESDVDCGGTSTCDRCATGDDCTAGADCASGVCTALKCAAPACNDTVQNGNETDVDCGGTCSPCASGKKCSVNTDCVGSPGNCLGTGLCQ